MFGTAADTSRPTLPTSLTNIERPDPVDPPLTPSLTPFRPSALGKGDQAAGMQAEQTAEFTRGKTAPALLSAGIRPAATVLIGIGHGETRGTGPFRAAVVVAAGIVRRFGPLDIC